MTQLTEEWWHAVRNNDAAYDGIFYYAVKSTGIFCRPSCKSRVPKREHVGVFRTADEAIQAGYRACKRCKPTELHYPDQEWVRQIRSCIDSRYTEPLTLQTLADLCHGSPYHLLRTFKRITGTTPNEYIRTKRVEHAARALAGSLKSIADIADEVGIPNLSYFTTLFKKETGLTPNRYRQLHSSVSYEEFPASQ